MQNFGQTTFIPAVFLPRMIQQKPLNVITLGHYKSDNINQMITITDGVYLVIFSKWDIEIWSHLAAENINQCNTCEVNESVFCIFTVIKKEVRSKNVIIIASGVDKKTTNLIEKWIVKF